MELERNLLGGRPGCIWPYCMLNIAGLIFHSPATHWSIPTSVFRVVENTCFGEQSISVLLQMQLDLHAKPGANRRIPDCRKARKGLANLHMLLCT